MLAAELAESATPQVNRAIVQRTLRGLCWLLSWARLWLGSLGE